MLLGISSIPHTPVRDVVDNSLAQLPPEVLRLAEHVLDGLVQPLTGLLATHLHTHTHRSLQGYGARAHYAKQSYKQLKNHRHNKHTKCFILEKDTYYLRSLIHLFAMIII